MSDIAVRCWSPLAIGISALFVYLIGRRLWSPRTGIAAMAILASSPLVILEGLAATADALLLAATCGAMAAFVSLMTSRPSVRHAFGLAAALSVGQLTKGPVGIAVPLAIMLGTLLIARDRIPNVTRLLRVTFIAAASSVAVFALWAVPANAATGGLFGTEGLGREVLLRALRPTDGHGLPGLVLLPFYLPVIAIGFAPWSVLLPAAFSGVLGNPFRWRPQAQPLLVSWISCR